MATLRDGLGGEEIAGSGLQEGGTNISPYFTGSVTSESQMQGTDMIGTTSLSGLNVYAQDEVTGSTVSNDDGKLYSVGADNATTTFGFVVRAGSGIIGDASSGTISFKTDFADANYFICLTPNQWTLPVASNTSGTGFSISGTRRASGCQAYGPSGTVFDWIAVGQR